MKVSQFNALLRELERQSEQSGDDKTATALREFAKAFDTKVDQPIVRLVQEIRRVRGL